ncbi:hypothetical protein SDC9_23738 [bioreactor metagenome]|uniref:DUF1998 domain-containing protein n=1 Tax=bioreactor metagenome TaxID=1076179 RepID=A0A644UFW7_9ZZZZ
MERGKSQVMFRYLPESVIDFSDTHTIGKVVSWNTIPLNPENLNVGRIYYEIVERRLKRFPSKKGYPDKPKSESFIFLEPKKVNVEIFPLTFICNKCGKAYTFDKLESFKKVFAGHGYHCVCGGSLKQLDLVHYHNCGKIESPKVSKCSKHGYQEILLYKGGSRRLSDWRWQCGICGEKTGSLRSKCYECDDWMKTAPFRQSQVFYPHSFSLINTIGNHNLKTFEDQNLVKLYLSHYLGLISDGDYDEIRNSDKELGSKDKVSAARQRMIDKGYSKKDIDEILGPLDGSETQNIRDNAIKNVDQILNLSQERLNTIVSSLQGFNETLNLKGSQTIGDVIEEAKKRAESNFTTICQFPKALNDIGVSNAYVVSDLPLVSVVFGYTRVSVDPQECTLRSFPRDENYPEKTPIYVNSNETEGIILEIDRYKILKWLKMNNIISSIPSPDDEVGLKSWFLNNIDVESIPVFDEIPPNLQITKYVYSLLHTMSHVLIRKAAGLIGIDKDSLGEIIFPAVPAILIYTNNVHDFQIGGMHTLFDTGIIPWTEMAKESAMSCLYDPVCISSEASCHACLHLSEGACEHFNRDLGRHYLIGRTEANGERTIGFWERDFHESVNK